ncbi:Retrovirus-related Pol polyprotein from transposon 297 [Vitis vinifera]|uniref:RNA-directed DNA polymerase n=1 Tax=Vitis vinifera TaxID=29760 RepID=A0A438KP99_VITVI|nr:Retrovirus-related Pol polyprotein from transposon 297 [Vitis vinifera]
MPRTPFFESLAKKPPTSMDDLFRRASKYSMLEDDVRAATQQVLVAGQAARSKATKSFKAPNHHGLSNRGQDERRPPLIRTPLTKSYEKLFPIIRDLPGFRWPVPIRSNPSERDRNKRCDYHKDHGHTTETCRSLHYMVEDLLKAGHLKQYIRTVPKGEGSSHGRGPRAPAAPVRVVINYIHGRPLDDEYSSKRKRQRLLRAATVREHVSSIQPGLASGGIHPIDGTIVFPAVDPAQVLQPHRDALILTLGVGDFDVKRILVDPGSSADLLQVAVIKQMGFIPSSLENPERTLFGFNGSSTTSLGDVTLPVQAGPVILNALFSVVEDLSPFNAILGRTWLHGMKVVPSTYHQMVSFITQDGQIDLYGSQLAARQYKDPPAADPLEVVQISEGGECFTYVSTLLPPTERFELQKVLQQNRDIFAWAHSDMPGILPSVASHQLNVLATSKPVRQKIRRFHPDRQKVIQEEMEKLLEVGFIREVEYPEWLSNVVVVPKKGGKWWVCVDYTNLNDACPKDSFPLPRIDQIVDATSGHEVLSFLDAFFGYHQIPMAPRGEEKTAFITPHGLYCYRVMPFGLKNVGATYQRLMTKIFKPLIGDVVEVYIDDVVVKSKTRSEHTQHLQKVFHLLRKYGMKLNPAKCAFGVSSGKFLGFMVTQRGIEINPNQVKAVANMLAPTNKKQLQRLTGKLVALGRSPQPGERLYLYLAVIDWAVSVVLLRSLSPREQRPVYFISKALADTETRYSRMEQTALALRTAAQKLRPYFQAHPITVLTNQPLRNVLHKPDITGRMLRWVIELSEYGIDYQPRLSLKGQVMADFIAELPEARALDKESTPDDWWSLHVDGASRLSGSGVELLLKAPTGERLEQSIRLDFPTSNNKTEYEAILSGLSLATTLNASKVKIHSDSQLVVGQILKEYEANDERMAKYLLKVEESLSRLESGLLRKSQGEIMCRPTLWQE